MPTVKAILANRLVPGLLDRVLARWGYASQLTEQARPADAPANLFHSVPGAYGAHGRFDAQARPASSEFFVSRHRGAMLGWTPRVGWRGHRWRVCRGVLR